MSMLLAADEPDPVILLRPEAAGDFVLLVDHAGRLIPRSLGDLGVSEEERARHIAWDIGIQGVSEHLSQALDAATVMQRYSRLVIDCNRQPGVQSSIPVVSEATPIPGNQTVDPAQADARRAEIFDPYHAAIAALLDRRAAAGRRTVLVAMHSFTPVYLGRTRPMHVAVLYNRDPRLAQSLLQLLQAEPGLVVGDNDPYRVTDETDYAIPVHGERRGLPHVEIEIRQDLIAAPDGQSEWASRLARLLPRADATMRESRTA